MGLALQPQMGLQPSLRTAVFADAFPSEVPHNHRTV